VATKRWDELSERNRRLIVVIGSIEGMLKIVALADLRRRSDAEVRGSKRVWAVAISLSNSAGLIPLAYLLRGRRPRQVR
jgi:hypothetical protein